MKIDCPHCGVHGSVDDSLAGRKLRCPKCSKVFLITEDILPEGDATIMVPQEILYDDESQSLETAEQETVDAEETVDLDKAEEAAEEAVVEGSEEREEISADDDSDLEQCSVCNQAFASEFLVEIESKRYCALCRPDSEEEGLDLLDKDDSEDDFQEDDSEEESVELETCSGCGESLHPDFLETVGTKRYCALCAPEETEDEETGNEEGIEIEESEAIDDAQDEDQLEDETGASAQALMGDDDDEGEYPKELCSVCGEKFHRDFMQEVDSKLYCGVCQPEVIEEVTDGEMVTATDTEGATAESDEEGFGGVSDFTIGELLKEAWQKTKGAKGPIWGGMAVMYLILFVMSLGGTVAFQGYYKGPDPMMVMGVNVALQLVAFWLSMLMTGGVMLIGVRRVLDQRVSWKMVFAGFSSAKALSMTIAVILQTILVIIGFLFLVLPGIYLSIGYALTLPLILDKGMGPWEALEASRKAIHKKWWSVFGLYLMMGFLYAVSAIPLGLGLIWTVPMFFVLIGVLYVRLFGADGSVEEEGEEEIEDEGEEIENEGEKEEVSEETEQVKQ